MSVLTKLFLLSINDRKKGDFFEGVADRSVLLTLMKQEVKEKWHKKYLHFPKADTLREVITEVGKPQPSTKEGGNHYKSIHY